jgi:hypothetical protein
MKTTIFRSSWIIAIAGVLTAPAMLEAQRTDSVRTHVVRDGETLWNLAATYLGDGNRWREILALNPNVRETRDLPVGQALRIPGPAGSRSAPAATSATSTGTTPTPPPSARGRTMFYGNKPAGGFVDSIRTTTTEPAVPSGIYEGLSAPWVIDSLTLSTGGRCVSVGPTASDARGVQRGETMTIRPPGSAVAGSRWLLVRRGPLLPGIGPVVIPTGVVRLTSDAASGGGAVGEVVAQFGFVSCSDIVLAAPDLPGSTGGELAPVSNGVQGRVAWVTDESILPSLGHALILDLTAESGVRAGDRVTIYRADGGAVVATAEVVRVELRSTTVRVVHQTQPKLSVGLPVRVTEKLP